MNPNVEFVRLDEHGVVVESGVTDATAFGGRLGKIATVRVVHDADDYPLGWWYDEATQTAVEPREGVAYQNGLRVMGLPVPCAVQIDDGEAVVCNDGVLEFDHFPPGS